MFIVPSCCSQILLYVMWWLSWLKQVDVDLGIVEVDVDGCN
jgi:hypothetical protein